jgi:hypothetical protein
VEEPSTASIADVKLPFLNGCLTPKPRHPVGAIQCALSAKSLSMQR